MKLSEWTRSGIALWTLVGLGVFFAAALVVATIWQHELTIAKDLAPIAEAVAWPLALIVVFVLVLRHSGLMDVLLAKLRALRRFGYAEFDATVRRAGAIVDAAREQSATDDVGTQSAEELGLSFGLASLLGSILSHTSLSTRGIGSHFTVPHAKSSAALISAMTGALGMLDLPAWRSLQKVMDSYSATDDEAVALNAAVIKFSDAVLEALTDRVRKTRAQSDAHSDTRDQAKGEGAADA